ncbi:hypothetical protein [Flavobacterium sp. XS2P14]|uniref:hypothetical protein n=1 Tax=Flavobacterium sp. XS2P14 TaxID=3401735 RepID=UPI003AAE01A4
MTNLKKISLLIVLVTSVLIVSCEADNVEQDQVSDANAIVEPKKESLAYTYQYKDKLYNEKEWNEKIKSINNLDYSIIGLNENLYVFDTNEEAQIFEKGALQQKIKEKSVSTKAFEKTTSEDILLGSATIVYSIKLWDKINYDNSGYFQMYYRTQIVKRWKPRNLYGDFYLTGAEFETDLPTEIRKKVSSCKLNFIEGGSVLTSNGGPMYLMCKIYLNAGTLADDSRLSYVSTLYKGHNTGVSTRDISDFRDHRMWSLFGITTWNDNIQSIQVKIR